MTLTEIQQLLTDVNDMVNDPDNLDLIAGDEDTMQMVSNTFANVYDKIDDAELPQPTNPFPTGGCPPPESL